MKRLIFETHVIALILTSIVAIPSYGGSKPSENSNAALSNWLRNRSDKKVCSKFVDQQVKLDKYRSKANNLMARVDALNNSKDSKTKAHQFFRAWPNLTHSFLKKKESELKDLLKHKGEILADVHVENFGFISDDNSTNGIHVVFGVNDFDEAGFGAYASDLIRLYGSVLLADGLEGEEIISKRESKCLLESYKVGLVGGQKVTSSNCNKDGGEQTFPSKYVIDALVELNKEYQEVEDAVYLKDVEDYIKNGDTYSFSEAQKNEDGDFCSLGTQRQDSVLTAFKKANPGIKFMDSFARCKKLGGSGGLGRSLSVVKDIDGKVKVLELKRISKVNAPKVWSSVKNYSHYKKLRNAVALFTPQLVDELSVFKFNDGKKTEYYLKRYATLAKKSFKPFKLIETKKGEEYKYKKKKIKKMLSDQFYSLGLFHRVSMKGNLDKIEAYQDSIERKEVISTAKDLVKYYNEFYQACK